MNVNWRNWSLVIQLTLTMTILIVVVVIGITLLAIRREQEVFRTELQQQAALMLDTLSAGAGESLYFLDADALSRIIHQANKSAVVISTRFYDADGLVLAGSGLRGTARSVKIDPLGQQLVGSDGVFFEWQSDRLVAGQAVRVGSQTLGAISVELSTASLNAKVAAVRNQGFIIAVIAANIGLLVALLVSQSIIRPLQELVNVTRHIAGGDLSQKITTRGRDEIALLGNAMEHMRAELQELYLGLEQQVSSRTKEVLEGEARFRQTIASISDHIYMAELGEDKGWINRYSSPNVEVLTGYPLEKFTIEPHFWLSLVHPHDKVVADAHLEQLAAGQSSEVEYRLIQASGNVIWVRESGRVEKDAEHRLIKVYGVVSEITQRKQVEEELVLARDGALEANRLKSELLAKVSHELRTPLSAILGFSEMLEHGVYGSLSNEQQQAIAQIVDSAEYLTTLVNELLVQARLEAGQMKLNLTAFAPTDIIDTTLSKMNVLAQAKGLTLAADVAADVPPTLCGDQDRLQQILLNLVSNAIKFTKTGTVGVRLYRPDAGHWAIQVSDTGIGIPAEAHSHIFEPFGQVDGSITREYHGTGLGLSIVKQLTTLMEGQIYLESKVEEGSRFTVILPLKSNTGQMK